jgi:chromosome segregation protein
LEREAVAAQATEAELHALVEQAKATLSDAADRRVELEQAVTDAERAHLAAVRAVADRREGLARLAGQVEALRSKTNATAEEIERMSTALVEAAERAETAAVELAEAEAELAAEQDTLQRLALRVEADRLRAENERLRAELARSKAALEVVGKAHALLELLSESADTQSGSSR